MAGGLHALLAAIAEGTCVLGALDADEGAIVRALVVIIVIVMLNGWCGVFGEPKECCLSKAIRIAAVRAVSSRIPLSAKSEYAT